MNEEFYNKFFDILLERYYNEEVGGTETIADIFALIVQYSDDDQKQILLDRMKNIIKKNIPNRFTDEFLNDSLSIECEAFQKDFMFDYPDENVV